MSSIVLDVSFIKIGIIFTAVYVFFSFIGMLFKLETGEGWLAFFKTLAYGGLAYFIYRYVTVKELTEITIVDAFTFILCCFECAGNLIAWIKSIIKYFSPLLEFFKDDNKSRDGINR